jgi:histidine ammonia-lyase
VGSDEAGPYSRRMLRDHAAGQGPLADEALVRATMARLANLFAEGSTGVRPELAERLVDALNAGASPPVRTRGSVGQGDLIPLADLALGVFGEVDLEPGEGLALLGSNAFATAAAALAVDDAVALLDTLDAVGALSLEGFGANLTILHPRVAEVRPYPGLATALARFRELLDGSDLLRPGAARHLQDPLTRSPMSTASSRSSSTPRRRTRSSSPTRIASSRSQTSRSCRWPRRSTTSGSFSPASSARRRSAS